MGSQPVGYSASRVSSLIGLNPYQTPTEAFQILKEEQEPGWNAAHGYKLPEFQDSAPLRWGTAFESAIIKLAEEVSGDKITDRERFFSKTIGNVTLTCHIDGMFSDGTIFEGKTVNDYAFRSVKKEIKNSIDENGNLSTDFKLVRSWGDDLTDNVPATYQVQCAVQRICSEEEKNRLYALVFPKAAEDFEAMGWVTWQDSVDYNWWIGRSESENEDDWCVDPYIWSQTLCQIGNFHTYNLPSNPALETAIIQAVQRFDSDHLQPGIPPDPTTWDDVKRLLSSPVGTIIATDDLRSKAIEYSELTKQLGSTSPLRKRRDALRVEIMTEAMHTQRSDWTNPPGKLVIIDPNGGEVLASLSTDKNDQLSFRAVRAR